MAHQGLFRVARDKYYLDVRTRFQSFADPCRTVQARHNHVGHEYVDAQVAVFQQFESLFGIFRLDNLVTAHLKRATSEGAYGCFVFDQ